MLDYDSEAARYDETRGGVPRADAAARAILELLPAHATTLLDVACGTGIVSARVAERRPGLAAFGADASIGMARFAAERIGAGRVVLADCGALPFASGSLDAVTAIWLLHLIDSDAHVKEAGGRVAGTIAEAARVLRTGGTLIATVDKDAAHDVDSDIDVLLAPYRNETASDAIATVCGYGAQHGLRLAGQATFVGHGQGRTPRSVADSVRRGYFRSAARIGPADIEPLARALEALPEPDVRRAEPLYRVIALARD